MRLCHVSDLHFGRIPHSRPDPAAGIPDRLLDVARCWNAAIDVAIANHASPLIVAGDVFEAPNPDATAVGLFASGVRRATRGGVNVVAIDGNHDRKPHPGRPSILGALHAPDAGLWTSQVPEILDVDGLKIATLPSVSRHHLMAITKYMRSQADEEIVEGLRRILDGLRAEGADVLVGHWPVSGTMLGSEKDVELIAEPMLAPADLDGPWSYVAFGHIHKRQTIPAYDATYAGSIDRMDFGEEGEAKGGYVVDLEPLSIVPFDVPATRFVTVDFRGRDVSRFEGEDARDAIVRCRGVRSDIAAHVRANVLNAGARSVQIEIAREERTAPRAAGIDKARTPLEALDLYLDAQNVPQDDRPAIREEATALMEGGTE